MLMNYDEWNHAISQHFFNPNNAGKDTYLYITKLEIIKIGKKNNKTTLDDQQTWNDFLNSISGKNITSNGALDLIDNATLVYKNWKEQLPTNQLFPSFLTYLVFFVLPLTDEVNDEFNVTNYYGRLNSFLQRNNINAKQISTQSFRRLGPLWHELENWANDVNNRDLGAFSIRPFTNEHWIYVGKPFSQCIFPPQSIKRLPYFFAQTELTPNLAYSDAEMRKHLIIDGKKYLNLNDNIIKLLKDNNNELANSIIEITNKEYEKWTGEDYNTDSEFEEGTKTLTKKNDTIASLFLQFKLNDNDETVSFSYRLFSKNEYPEDLQFNDFENIYETNGYSKTLDIPYKNNFELKDLFNKWVARFPKRDVRIFINANSVRLSSKYWIETNHLTKIQPMYLLCKSELLQSIIEWGNHFEDNHFKKIEYKGLPDGFSLFKFKNPTIDHPDIPLLTLDPVKRIEIKDGLKIGFRNYLKDSLPYIEIKNSDGKEEVYIEYKNSYEKVNLKKVQVEENVYFQLPENIKLNADFCIKLKNESAYSDNLAYVIESADRSSRQLKIEKLPKRNSFGKITEDEADTKYLQGSIPFGINPISQSAYQQFFRKQNPTTFVKDNIDLEYDKNKPGNILLNFLTLKSITRVEDFYSIFENLYTQISKNSFINESNISKIKKYAINFYDYLGYLDYDYETKSIVVNPPQLILIPKDNGRCAMLIGGRDNDLVKLILKNANRFNVNVQLVSQFKNNEKYLLPDSIILQAFGDKNDRFGELNLINLAREVNIKFEPNNLIQIGLLDLSANICEYESFLFSNLETDKKDYEWVRKIFNVNTLKFEKFSDIEFNQDYSLVEYKLNEYTYIYKLWNNQIAYAVDKNWGKFLCLKQHQKNVILYDEKVKRVAIPVELPLPRLLAESLMLLSGIVPEFSKIDNSYYLIYENVYHNYAHNLFTSKLNQKLQQRDL